MNFENIFFDISDFKLGKLIAKGSFAKYYIAKDLNDGSKFVAKMYLNDGQCTYSDQIDVLREVQILYKLQHPSIINFYGVNFQSFYDPSQINPSIILDYFPNGSLRNIIDKEKKGKSSTKWNLTKKYINLLGICHAMKTIHKSGILHRNLKPENILLDSNFYPILSDFLLSQLFESPLKKSTRIQLGRPVGTPLYMAPELILEDEFYGIGVDVYAFGMISYEILSLKMPGYETDLSLSILIVDRPFYRPHFEKNITQKMKELICKCLDSCQDERPSFDEIFEKMSTDFSYFSGDFDEEEILNYIQKLENKESSDNSIKEFMNDEENYRVIKILNESINSKSFKVFDKKNQKFFYNKVYEIHSKTEKFNTIEKVVNKFQLIHSLNHPCLCSATAINLSKPNKFESIISLFFEFIDFKLNDCLNFNIINNTLRTRIVVEIAHGMAYLHKKGLFFGKFNIDSIMLNSIFNIKIRTDEFLNTDDQNEFNFDFFQSPEFKNSHKYDDKSDVYSFGVVAFYIFHGKPEKKLSKEYLNSFMESIETSSKCCFDLILRCIADNPNDRPSFDGILIFLRENDYSLSFDVDASIVSQRDKELQSLNI